MFQRLGPKAFKKDLSNIYHLSTYLGDPHQSFKSIHIAGTNGKGSTSYFIATALHAMGYKVGLYTSPHYRDYRERIKVDGEMIDKNYVKKFVNQLIQDDVLSGEFKPSFFEITVGMAFSYFKEMEVDYAVIETGVGGRLDSTNIITPEVSVITNIGLDHVQFLGNTLALIAGEKAGIIKPSIPVVIGRKQKETQAVFRKVAKVNKAQLHYAQEMPAIEVSKKLLHSFPSYQKENLQTAYSCLCTLLNKVPKSKLTKAWTEGLSEWGYMGRYMKVSLDPITIYDSAHNIDGITILLDELKNEQYEQLHIILAMVGDKDQSKVLQLFPKDAHYYFSQASIPRAMDKDKLSAAAQEYDLTGKVYSTVRKALSAAHRKANKNDLVLVAGSIFTVAEVV
jgi:dihydrofolate synthase/folylpolyglutamate synthase